MFSHEHTFHREFSLEAGEMVANRAHFETPDCCERGFNSRSLPTPRDAMPRVKHS